jgi:Tfp pilus assembly PilM family ATPase
VQAQKPRLSKAQQLSLLLEAVQDRRIVDTNNMGKPLRVAYSMWIPSHSLSSQ